MSEIQSYKDRTAWKDLQRFLPPRLAFSKQHSPVEEWWDCRGYQIHLDRWRNPSATTRIILHHGVGTNGRQMSMILGVPLHTAGYELVAIDMPGYGCTATRRGKTVAYGDWVQIANDFINAELDHDPRPIVLYGLSAGGMLAYHVAALNRKVRGVIGMTFLDQRVQQVRDETSRNFLTSRIGIPLAKAFNVPLIRSISLPMQLVSKMSALANDQAALAVFLKDKSSAGSWASLRFLSTYMTYNPVLEPEEFDVCPILLTQPVKDKWTPLHLSDPVLSRVRLVPVYMTQLDNAGHYPLEDPGLQQMADAVIEFLRKLDAMRRNQRHIAVF